MTKTQLMDRIDKLLDKRFVEMSQEKPDQKVIDDLDTLLEAFTDNLKKL